MRPQTKRRIGKIIVGGLIAAYIGLGIKTGQKIQVKRPFEEIRAKGIPVAESVNANYPGYCAAYAKDIARQVSKKRYPLGNAWDLPKRTRVTASLDFHKTKKGFEQKEIEKMISTNTLTPGTIMGLYYPQSPNNRTNRQFTHVMVYLGEKRFAGNVKGPEIKTLEQIYKEKKMFPVCIMEPKE